MTDTSTKHAMPRAKRPVIAHTIRPLAVPIILVWVFITVLVNVLVPQLEVVGEEHSAPMVPADAPSMEAMKRTGHNFREYDSNSSVMIVLEGQKPLGDDAHRYYSELVDRLSQDRKHVQHVLNLWGIR
jgi:putative drug exporter of the RND superfamily